VPKSLKSVIEEANTHHIFLAAVSAWANRDLNSLAPLIADEVIRNVNVDPVIVPFAASVVGKDAYLETLQLNLQKFEFGAYVTDFLQIDGNIARASMKTIWTHRGSGEMLKTRHTVVVTQRNGKIVSFDKYCDAAYLEAFARLVATCNRGYEANHTSR